MRTTRENEKNVESETLFRWYNFLVASAEFPRVLRPMNGPSASSVDVCAARPGPSAADRNVTTGYFYSNFIYMRLEVF